MLAHTSSYTQELAKAGHGLLSAEEQRPGAQGNAASRQALAEGLGLPRSVPSLWQVLPIMACHEQTQGITQERKLSAQNWVRHLGEAY